DFAHAETLLGKPYSISGRIAYGQQLGRKLGVPTANVHLRRYRSPLHGVFTVTVKFVDGNVHQGVANVGVRPTVTGDRKPLLEVHLFDFSRKVYGAMIDVIFHTKLRDEKKFNSLDELQTQLQTDIAQGQDFFRRNSLS
ncbi:MAG TPA: riboflavin kinase, partial [Cellvibrio sp.]